jgi:hypothetical protein
VLDFENQRDLLRAGEECINAMSGAIIPDQPQGWVAYHDKAVDRELQRKPVERAMKNLGLSST